MRFSLLGKLRVRQKLVLLVVPLLVLVVAETVPLVMGSITAAGRSDDDVRMVKRAVRIGTLVEELQQERLASLSYLSGAVRRDNVVARSARVVELARQVATNYGSGDADLNRALRQVSDPSGPHGIRSSVLSKQASGLTIYTDFTESIRGLLDVLNLLQHVTQTNVIGRQQLALDAIVRHDEVSAAAGAALFIEPVPRVTVQVISLIGANLGLQDRERRRFVEFAEPSSVDLYQKVEMGRSGTRVTAYLTDLTNSSSSRLTRSPDPNLLFRVESLTLLRRLVGEEVAARAVSKAEQSAATNRRKAGTGVAVALLVLAAAALLSMLISRSITRPLRRLTVSADEVAELATQTLERMADTDDPDAAVPRLRPVPVSTSDELGELASAFNRVQQTATDLVERQLDSRRNVATMFGHVGRRTQNLVGRQLAIIDGLEQNQPDLALLNRLYRLDHVSTRLRRNANSLVVLSGAEDQDIGAEPLTVADAVRAALGEIEDFQRVRTKVIAPAVLTPQVATDTTLLLAELLENGTSFSPPHTAVEVDAGVAGDGRVVVRIVDHGLGMTAEQLAVENGRLVERERLDLAPTDVLGLFVVSRLARRHRIEVLLAQTPGGGVTAEVRIPAQYVVRPERSAALVPAPRESGPQHTHSGPGLRGIENLVPWPRLAPDDPGGAERSRALFREFDATLRRALLRLDGLSTGSTPDAVTFWARRSAQLMPARDPAPVGRPDVYPGLPRRVPGAQLQENLRAGRPGVLAEPAPAPVDSAEQAAALARALVEDFEAGAERALRHDPSGRSRDAAGELA